MWLEVLVVTVCANGYDGCSQATSGYYQQSKELQQISKNAEEIGKKITKNHEWIVYAGTPLYAVATRQPAKILVYRGTTINLDPWKQAFALQWSY